MWMMMGFWDSKWNCVCREVASQRLLSSKWWLQQGSSSFAGCLLFCSHHFFITTILFSAESKEGCPSFAPPLPRHDTDVMSHSWLHWIRHESKGKEVRKVKRERWKYCHLQAQKHCPVVSTWEHLATQEEILGARTGMGQGVDGSWCWACTQRMKEAVQHFHILRLYSILIPAVPQVSRWQRNHGGRSGICHQKLQI